MLPIAPHEGSIHATGYSLVDDEDDLDLYSEEYARRRDDPAFFGWKGLDPVRLPDPAIFEISDADALRAARFSR